MLNVKRSEIPSRLPAQGISAEACYAGKKIKSSLLTFSFFIIPLLIIFISSILSCNSVEPPVDIEPGRRDYVWNVDTVSSPPNLFYLINLWGNSPTNLWAVGPADETINSLWHYDGKIWKKTTQRLSSNLSSIFGFDSSDIWICDSPGGNIFQFDGTTWNKIGYFPYPGYSLTYLNNIWGVNPDEIYIAGSAYDQGKGSKAILMHYDGIKWNFINLPQTDVSLIWVRKSIEDGYLYFTAVKNLPTGDTIKIIQYNGNILKDLYVGTEIATVNEMNGKIYIAIGNKVYKYINDKLEIWKDFSSTRYLGRVWGRNEKDFFGVAGDGLAHYNGTDLKTIYPTNLFINDLFVMEKEIFMLCENRIIIHGKLKNE